MNTSVNTSSTNEGFTLNAAANRLEADNSLLLSFVKRAEIMADFLDGGSLIEASKGSENSVPSGFCAGIHDQLDDYENLLARLDKANARISFSVRGYIEEPDVKSVR